MRGSSDVYCFCFSDASFAGLAKRKRYAHSRLTVAESLDLSNHSAAQGMSGYVVSEISGLSPWL
jgi:hypothetical protein